MTNSQAQGGARHTATTVAQLVVRTTGLIQLTVGMLFWAGVATGLVPVHMLIGFVLVLGLWTLTALGVAGGAHGGLLALAGVWGLVVPVLGMTQERLLAGSAHWIIEVLHLLVGVAAIGLAEALAERIKKPGATTAEA